MLTLHDIYWESSSFSLSIPFVHFNDHTHTMIMGESGSGKTLLLSIIAGIVKPQKGTIYFYDSNITTVPPEKRQLSIMYQDPLLFPHLTVFENVSFGLRMLQMKKKEIISRTYEMLTLCGIAHLAHRDTKTLSGGEKQKVAFARAIVTEPKILLLDEPFAALDPLSKDHMIELLKTIKRHFNPLIIHITHDFDETIAMSDYVCVMRDGKIVQHGTVFEVYQYPKDIFVATLVGARNIFEGKIVHTPHGSYFVTQKGCKFFIGSETSDHFHYAVIRQEDIVIANKKQQSSATNQFRGTVKEIQQIKGMYKITVDIGEVIHAIITKKSLLKLGIQKGCKVYIIFKGSAIHLF